MYLGCSQHGLKGSKVLAISGNWYRMLSQTMLNIEKQREIMVLRNRYTYRKQYEIQESKKTTVIMGEREKKKKAFETGMSEWAVLFLSLKTS